MAQGDIDWTYAVFVVAAKSKTNTAITLGNVVKFDTDGWADAARIGGGTAAWAVPGLGMALDTKAAVTSVQTDIRVVLKGVVELVKVASASHTQGQVFEISATSGKVVISAVPSGGAAYGETTNNTAIQRAVEVVGMAVDTVASTTAVKVLLGR